MLLNHTRSGYQYVPVTPSEVIIEAVNILNLRRDWYKSLLKLHQQFSHPLNQKTSQSTPICHYLGYDRIELEQIQSICELCTAYKQANSIKISC